MNSVDIFDSVKRGDANSFWRWFAKSADRIARDYEAMLSGRMDANSVMEKVGQKLHQYHPDLAFEIGKDGNLFDFVLSAEGMRDNIASVMNLHRSAPSIPRWKVTAFRKRMALSEAKLKVCGTDLDWNRVFFKLGPPDDGRCDLTIGFEAGSLPADMKLNMPGFLTADLALGEYDVMTKIGHVDFVWIEPGSEAQFAPIAELADEFDNYFREAGN